MGIHPVAIKRLLAWQLEQAMQKQQKTKRAMAKQLHTSRSQLDRLLDPRNVSVTLDTMARAARVLGKRIIIRVADVKNEASVVQNSKSPSVARRDRWGTLKAVRPGNPGHPPAESDQVKELIFPGRKSKHPTLPKAGRVGHSPELLPRANQLSQRLAGIFANSLQLRVSPIALGEVWPIFVAQRPDQCVAALLPDLAIVVATAII
jgi:hypothetical protein